MKTFISFVIIMLFLIIPMTGFSIIFLKKDEKGVYHFRCENSTTLTITIKMINKNTFKVLGPYVGQVVSAESEHKAAQIVCGEAEKKIPESK